VTDAPAFTVHDGNSRLPNWRRQLIAAWLTANDVVPSDVSADHPITILTVPFRPPETADDGGPWLVQVIVLHQYFTRADGTKEQNLLTRRAVTFQRTVPLKTTFPADPTTDGEDHGQADRQEPEEAPEEVVRPARKAGLSDPRQGPRPSSTVSGQAARDEGAAEEGPRRGDKAVPGHEEDRRKPEEEVGDA
jgi:hypothetical protein